MVLDDNCEVVVENVFVIIDKANFVAILILQLIGLEVLEHRGSWKIVRYPAKRNKELIHRRHCHF